VQARGVKLTAVARRVLIVEDNIDDARLLATLLGMMGHRVEYAINATVAVDLAKNFAPDYAFIDLRLPDGHGADVARQILAASRIDTRVYAVTASTNEVDRARALKAGCVDILTKPVASETFEKILARV